MLQKRDIIVLKSDDLLVRKAEQKLENICLRNETGLNGDFCEEEKRVGERKRKGCLNREIWMPKL